MSTTRRNAARLASTHAAIEARISPSAVLVLRDDSSAFYHAYGRSARTLRTVWAEQNAPVRLDPRDTGDSDTDELAVWGPTLFDTVVPLLGNRPVLILSDRRTAPEFREATRTLPFAADRDALASFAAFQVDGPPTAYLLEYPSFAMFARGMALNTAYRAARQRITSEIVAHPNRTAFRTSATDAPKLSVLVDGPLYTFHSGMEPIEPAPPCNILSEMSAHERARVVAELDLRCLSLTGMDRCEVEDGLKLLDAVIEEAQRSSRPVKMGYTMLCWPQYLAIARAGGLHGLAGLSLQHWARIIQTACDFPDYEVDMPTFLDALPPCTPIRVFELALFDAVLSEHPQHIVEKTARCLARRLGLAPHALTEALPFLAGALTPA